MDKRTPRWHEVLSKLVGCLTHAAFKPCRNDRRRRGCWGVPGSWWRRGRKPPTILHNRAFTGFAAARCMPLPIICLRLPEVVAAGNAVVGKPALVGIVPRPDRKFLRVCVAELLACRSIVGDAHLNASDIALMSGFAHDDSIETRHSKPRVVVSSCQGAA